MHGLMSILIYIFIIYAVPRETKISAVTKAPGEIQSARNHRSTPQFFHAVMRKFDIISNDEKYKANFVNFWRNPQILKFCCYMHDLDTT